MADQEENLEVPKSNMMKIIIVVVGAILLIGIGVGVALGGKDGDSSDAQNTENAVEKIQGPPIYVRLSPAFVVNFEDQTNASFLQLDVEVMTFDPAVEEAINMHMPAIRNELLLLFGGQKYEEINTREGKRKLSEEAMTAVQDVLKKFRAPDGVESVLFTSFVMQ